jgi:hypothetical protein
VKSEYFAHVFAHFLSLGAGKFLLVLPYFLEILAPSDIRRHQSLPVLTPLTPVGITWIGGWFIQNPSAHDLIHLARDKYLIVAPVAHRQKIQTRIACQSFLCLSPAHGHGIRAAGALL